MESSSPSFPPTMTAPRAYPVAAASTGKRADSGVALGLFSKIAAARKEKLSPFSGPLYTESSNDRAFERRGSTPPLPGSQFPEIHDPPIRSIPIARGIPPNPRKVTSRAFAQNLRWSKLEDARVSRTPLGPPPVRTPPIRSTLEKVRRASAEPSTPPSIISERILPLDELGNRPATTGDDPGISNVRGFVRRSLDLTNNLELPVATRRAAEWSSKPCTADSSRASPSLKHHADILVLEATVNKSPPEPVPDVPEQEIYFAETDAAPGMPIVYRHQKAKALNPERLNLDRRNLAVVPLLEGETMLRLLNLQNNVIRKIENLMGLPNLIFLDLYNNRIEKLENFHAVPNLRVLMLGKNRLKRIEHLESLKKLDVLDLHSNEIERMENLNDLVELRVLNLGGNRIKTLEGIERLSLLTELNLRRNHVDRLGDIGRLPSLQRLFLSNNHLETLEALEPLLHVTSLVELRLDNNSVCDSNQSEYRARMIKSFPLLKHLDLRPLSDTERKESLVQQTQATKNATKEREELEERERTQLLSLIRSQWERRDKGGVTSMIATRKRPSRSDLSSSTSAWGATGPSQGNRLRPRPSASVINSTIEEDDKQIEVKPMNREDYTIHRNKSGISEIEVYNDYRILSIYGDALDALESAKVHTSVNAIKFRYVSIERIATVATSASSSNLKLFARLRRLNFAHNDIESLEQLAWIATMGTKAEELFITHNAVCHRTLVRPYVAIRLGNVIRLNGEEIALAERQIGRQLFPKTSRPKPPETLVESALPKTQRENRPPTRSGVAANAAAEIVSSATDIEKKEALLEASWSDLLAAVVKETLTDISQRESCLSGCLDGL